MIITRDLLRFLNIEPTTELIDRVNEKFVIFKTGINGIKIKTIFQYVSKKHDVDLEDVIGKRRFRQFVKPRHEAFFIAYNLGFSTKKIGEFANCDHSTVIVGRDTIKGFMDVNVNYKNEILADIELLNIK